MLEEWIREFKADAGKMQWLKRFRGKHLLVVLVCLGMLALLWPVTSTEEAKQAVSDSYQSDAGTGTIKRQTTAALEGILAQISGAGKVQVSITLASDGSKSYATNTRQEKRTTEEKDAKGVVKTTVEENTSNDLSVSSGNPLLLETKGPEIIGVLVVADGARDAFVREKLMQATATLLDVPLYKVQVMPREGGI
ncbi:MAG: hypothetical protein ABRQ26_05000 [Syntrophomonadaceae bacterium]